jgi:DNA repair photolyase
VPEIISQARWNQRFDYHEIQQVVRDIDILKEIAAKSALHVNITITTLKSRLARLLEPRAPRPDLRISAIRELRAAGLNAGVLASPLLPGITDREDAGAL